MKKILFQLDTDALASTFDRVVAVDSGVDEIFSYGGVTTENVESLIHGGMFTRGPKDLKNTAVFIGGSRVADGEAMLKRVTEVFFGPMRLSVMMDSNGSNTTAAAAVLSAAKHLDLKNIQALVAGGTGPVGMRAAQLLVRAGAKVNLGSRNLDRAKQTCNAIKSQLPDAQLKPCETGTEV
ncbi:MAG: bifunctional NADP-dependent methylenetetrahydromethanopterin dehydrogenase/methylenetetrahydrofolate dehydrogenase, partial [Planctomycetaceae bacterium]|nr:bifunctional NADP-dependent methylenetetrahydromethanopterin dehydrogenase/methylenetetrahydrofolate dehydrogenase [Planctomycetaceae bacterium]